MRRAILFLATALAGPALAQSPPVVADTAAGVSLGTTVTQAGQMFTIDGGTRAGGNLFHSFNRFGLDTGQTARWTANDAASVRHVINRVTGGQESRILGTIDSRALPNADFWLINPAGIVFGAGARLDVPASAHFATASDLRLADGARFAIATPGGSTLSVAAPESFGFVGGQGSITISAGRQSFAPSAPRLTFAASDIRITDSNLSVGGLDLTAVGAGSASVSLADPLAGSHTGAIEVRDGSLVTAAGETALGPFRFSAGVIDFENARMTSDTAGAAIGSDILFQADRIRLGRDSFLFTSARGAGAGGRVELAGRELVVDATGTTTFSAGVGSSGTGSGAAGDVRLIADDVRLGGGAFVGSTVSGSADAGDVLIEAKNLIVDSAVINSAALPGSTGAGADIRLRADTFDLGAAIVTTQSFGAGRSGDVVIQGGSLLVSGGSFGSTPGGLADSGNLIIDLSGSFKADGGIFGVSTFSPEGAVAAGTISIKSSSLLMSGSFFLTQSSGPGAPGRVLIETRGDVALDEVFYDGDAKDGEGALPGIFRLRAAGDIFMRNVFFSSNTNGLADGGVIEVAGRNLELLNTLILTEAAAGSRGAAGQVTLQASGDMFLSNSQISSSTRGDGDAGDVRAEARAITLDVSSALRSDAQSGSTGRAGGVRVESRTLIVQESSAISSESQLGARGDAGEVSIDVGKLTLATAGSISSTTTSSGAGGTVSIRADEIFLAGESQGFTSILSETFGEGRGGNINIQAGKLTLDRGALISTVSRFDADAGGIALKVGDLAVLNGSVIATVSFGAGKSGDILINAENVDVLSDERFNNSAITSAGVRGGGGDIRLDIGRSLVVDFGQISSDTTNDGDAGDIAIKAGTAVLRNFGSISSSTQGFGDAGSISLQAKSVTLEQSASIISAATPLSEGGNAGSVAVAADNILVRSGSLVSTSTLSVGDAGLVSIRAKSLRLDGGFISSAAEVGSRGRARDVQIIADDVSVLNRGSIDTLSANPNVAGRIDIRAGTLLVDGLGSSISSENIAGDPTFTRSGPGGDAGTILIEADGLTISNGGRVTTNSFAGAAGDINVKMRRPGVILLQGLVPGVIQTSSGPGTGGRITINDPLAIISKGGSILALGERQGANVAIQTGFFINASDRVNTVAVDGNLALEGGVEDVSGGTVERDLSVLDASRVLRGQCPVARATGQVSQLITRQVGPHAAEPAPGAASVTTATPGACP